MGLTRKSRLRPPKPFETVIVYGEGETEGAFLCHLKSIYCIRNSGIQLKVDWTYGGSPHDLIEEAIKLKHGADYSRAALLMDMDVPWPEASVQKAKKNNIILIGNDKCIESLFLSILDSKKKWNLQTVKDCKREFHNNYLSEQHKTAPEKYEKIFPREVLDEARKRIPELDKLLDIMFKL